MATLASPPFTFSSLPQEFLASLAGTYDDAREAVWVEDRFHRCVYRNARARDLSPDDLGARTFEVTDHLGRLVGRLRTAAA